MIHFKTYRASSGDYGQGLFLCGGQCGQGAQCLSTVEEGLVTQGQLVSGQGRHANAKTLNVSTGQGCWSTERMRVIMEWFW